MKPVDFFAVALISSIAATASVKTITQTVTTTRSITGSAATRTITKTAPIVTQTVTKTRVRTTTVTVAPERLPVNGDFETGSVDPWEIGSEGAQMTLVNSTGVGPCESGASCVFVNSTGWEGYIDQLVAVEPGESYGFSGWSLPGSQEFANSCTANFDINTNNTQEGWFTVATVNYNGDASTWLQSVGSPLLATTNMFQIAMNIRCEDTSITPAIYYDNILLAPQSVCG